MNTASDVVLFLDTDDGSKHALLHLKMFLIKRELKDLQREQEFWTKSSQFRVSVPVGWDINHKEVCFEIGEAKPHAHLRAQREREIQFLACVDPKFGLLLRA